MLASPLCIHAQPCWFFYGCAHAVRCVGAQHHQQGMASRVFVILQCMLRHAPSVDSRYYNWGLPLPLPTELYHIICRDNSCQLNTVL